MHTLTASELKERLKKDPDLLVVNVLGADAYEAEHIPGSHNVPRGHDHFVEEMKELAGGVERELVVYCASKDCQASPKAARQLIDAGFTNVADFEGGMAEWKLAGFEVEQGAEVSA